MKVNMNKTIVTISGESRKWVQNTERQPCGRGVLLLVETQYSVLMSEMGAQEV